MARIGCGSHGLCLLRLYQRKGSLVGAGLAGTMRAVRLPAEVGDCRARFSDRAGSLTGALLPRPPRWLCLQRHDMARDKVIFACGPCRSVALQGMRPQSPADRRIWSVPCRGALPRPRICESAGAPQAMRPVQEKTNVGEAPEPAVPRCPAATNSPSTATHSRQESRMSPALVTLCDRPSTCVRRASPPICAVSLLLATLAL
jgi:hypothetical protein